MQIYNLHNKERQCFSYLNSIIIIILILIITASLIWLVPTIKTQISDNKKVDIEVVYQCGDYFNFPINRSELHETRQMNELTSTDCRVAYIKYKRKSTYTIENFRYPNVLHSKVVHIDTDGIETPVLSIQKQGDYIVTIEVDPNSTEYNYRKIVLYLSII